MYEVKEEQSIGGKCQAMVLHAPETAAIPCEVTSLGEVATNLMNDVKNERNLCQWQSVVPWNNTHNHTVIFFDAGVSNCQSSVECLPVSVHVLRRTSLVLVGCQHVQYTATVIVIQTHASRKSCSI